MMKLIVLAALLSVSVAQMSPEMMLMMSTMRGGGSGGGSGGSSAGGMGAMMSGMMSGMMGGGAGATGGGMGAMARMFNNPMILCRKTENMRPVPCGQMPQFCDMISISTYQFPGLMKCSPMGIGCCIKDMRSMMLINQMA